MNETLERDVELLFEIGTLRNITRSWNQLANARFQNVCEHNYRAAWIALILSHKLNKNLNIAKTLLCAISGGITVTRTGENHYISYKNVTRNTTKAIEDMFMNTSLQKLAVKTLVENLKRKSDEAKIAYVANGIENRLELRELEFEGLDIANIWGKQNDDKFIEKVPFEIGKKYWQAVAESYPYDWHLNSKNRFNFGNKNNVKKTQIFKDLNFFYEIGTLRNTDRVWSQFVGKKFANLTEHSNRVIWISLIISANYKKINYAELIIMAMLHDLSEVRSTDLNYINSEYIKIADKQALKETFNYLEKKDYLLNIYSKFKNHKTIEAKIVKDADRIDPVLELQEQEALGMKLAQQWKYKNIERLFGKLHTDYANQLLMKIVQSDPNDWHLKAKNRFDDPNW